MERREYRPGHPSSCAYECAIAVVSGSNVQTDTVSSAVGAHRPPAHRRDNLPCQCSAARGSRLTRMLKLTWPSLRSGPRSLTPVVRLTRVRAVSHWKMDGYARSYVWAAVDEGASALQHGPEGSDCRRWRRRGCGALRRRPSLVASGHLESVDDGELWPASAGAACLSARMPAIRCGRHCRELPCWLRPRQLWWAGRSIVRTEMSVAC